MGAATGWAKSFSLELLKAIHNFDSDVFKIALYGEAANISTDTTAYSATGEIAGTGYVAGGKALSLLATYPKLEQDRGAVRFQDAVWAGPSTFSYRKALIYNSSKANRAVLVVDFGSLRGPTNGQHTISAPLSSPPLVFIGRGEA